MSNKKAKNDKKGTQQKKRTKKKPQNTFMLELNNGDQVPAKNTYMENTDLFEIDKIDKKGA